MTRSSVCWASCSSAAWPLCTVSTAWRSLSSTALDQLGPLGLVVHDDDACHLVSVAHAADRPQAILTLTAWGCVARLARPDEVAYTSASRPLRRGRRAVHGRAACVQGPDPIPRG